jgi:gamma-glutamyltranspeptidase / glutathione hydrolase
MDLRIDDLVWPGRNQPVFATEGMVATSQPLAAAAGLAVLRDGGNAVDAAVATAAVLTVVEAPSCSIGGDAFALVWDGEHLHGLNGSGRAPAGLTEDLVRERGYDTMPSRGWLSVTVPGAPAAWRDLHERFGRLPFGRLIEPARYYAERGHPISPICAWAWRFEVDKVHPDLHGEEFAAFTDLCTSGGRAPQVGEIWRSDDLAWSLGRIAETNGDTVYAGEIAGRIVRFAEETGGVITADDLASHSSAWVEPLRVNYRGYDVWELPPNTQGIAASMAFNILEGFDLASLPRDSGESFHIQIEAMKLAFADTYRYVGDPDRVDIPVADLMTKEYAAKRRRLIGDCANTALPGDPGRGDTAYLCTADDGGMMVSFIQSSKQGFGSHVVVPGTGMVLQNRGEAFSLDEDDANHLEPGKRPFQTIIPGFLTKDGDALGPFGVMAGQMQPQGHVQMIVNTIDHGMDPQTSLDHPRWCWLTDGRVLLEPTVDQAVVGELHRRGHDVSIGLERDWFGRGQIIWRLTSGAYIAGSDSRGDGQAVGF